MKVFHLDACAAGVNPTTSLAGVLAAREPDDLADAFSDLNRRPEKAQRIAAGGRQLVATAHSISARAEQLRRSLRAIQEGTCKGADWIDGQFTVRKAN